LNVDQLIHEVGPAPFLGPPEIRLDVVADGSAGLAEELAASELLSTVAPLAGLLTLPEFHTNTLRLEVLTHLAAAYCAGKEAPTRDQIGRWLNQSLAPLAPLEDPVEDVFVTNVTSGLGNHRLFEGLWESADFWTQNILDVLSRIPSEADGDRLRWHVGALLKLSEEVASRSKIDRWTAGGGKLKVGLQLPNDAEVASLPRRVLFEPPDLERLAIQPEALEPFLLPNKRSETRSDEIGRSALERRPLLLVGDRVVLALPTAVSTAIRRFLVEECRLKALQSALRELQGSLLFDEVMKELQTTDRRVPPDRLKSVELPRLDDAICTFDSGRAARIVLLHDDLGEVRTEGFSKPHLLSPDKTVAFAEYLERTAAHLAEQPNYQGGLTIVVLGGIGRGSALGFGDLPKKWHLAVFSLADLSLVSHMSEMSLLRIWKMKEQLVALEERGTVLSCVNGDIGLLSYWCDQAWSFVPGDAPFRSNPHLMIGVASDWAANVRQKLRCDLDLHAAATPSGRYIVVTRFRRDAWFSALKRQPVFVSTEHLQKGALAGLVETPKRGWWIRIVESREQLKDPDFAYRTWTAVLDWMARVAPAIDELLPGSDPTVVEIEMGPLDGFDHTLSALAAIEPENPEAEVRKGGAIRVKLPLGFLAVLSDPTNRGERALCRAIAMAAAARCGVDWSGEFERIIERLFLDSGGREFHLKQSNDFRDLSRAFHSWRAHHIQPEDREWSKLGLAWLVEEPQAPHRIEGKEKSVKFLNDLVDKLWLRIREKLRELDRLSFTERCIECIEGNEVDAAEWRLSARAHFALNESRDEVLRVSREQELNRAAVAVAGRAAIEIATCESPVSGKEASEADLDAVLADINELVLLANQSDAIRHGYADAYIDVLASGRLIADDRFFATVLTPYVTEFYDSTLQYSADSYEKFIQPQRNPDPAAADPISQAFNAAFTAEYGVPPEAAVEIAFFLEQEALGVREITVRRSREEIEALLVEKTQQSDESISRFLEVVTLPIRQRWDDPRPNGFRARDWYPWRFRRRLSAISRPIIQIDDRHVLYSPGFLYEGLRYLVENAYSGDLPADFYRTPKMRAWIGMRTHERGERFNDLVLERVKKVGLSARARILMSELGVPEGAGDFRQSDIDVLAWSNTSGIVLLIECKRLIFAKTIGEIADQLNDFRMRKGPRGKNSLERHIERFNWLDANRTGLERITGIPASAMKLRPLIVTSRTVPMQFVAALPNVAHQITNLDNLSQWVSKVQAP
jgi:hypothetical protein